MTSPEPGHSHRLPRTLLVMVVVCIVGLLVAVVLAFTYARNVDARVGRLEQYVQGKGVDRDKEQRRLEEQMRRSTCDLLDQLPAGGLLERPRAKYHCGPGIPRSQLNSPPAAAGPGSAGARPAPAIPSAHPPAQTTTPPSPAAPPARAPVPPAASATATPDPVLPPICAVLGACR